MSDPGEAQPIRLIIDLDDDDPIQGEFIEPAVSASRFRGWLALTALIENARTQTPKRTLRRRDTEQPERPAATEPAADGHDRRWQTRDSP